jgi:hypothetical protein
MSVPKPPTWSLKDHLREGRKAVAAIAQEPLARDLQPLCHHFSEEEYSDPMKVSIEDTYAPLKPVFGALGLTFLCDGLEAWQRCRPSTQWLETLIPQLVRTASANGLIYEGWTWEPVGRQPIGACTIEVINHR